MSGLLIVNARLWDGTPLPQADAILIEAGRVVMTGTSQALRARAAGHLVLDAAGATVTPGLCDAHVHLAPWAMSLGQLALAGARTRSEALARVFEAAADSGPVLVGRGWDESGWEAPPDRASLDAVSGDRAVLLHRHDFHALWVNSAALRMAGVHRGTPDPEGGRFERDRGGEPTGLVRENAVRAFHALEAEASPPLDDALAEAAASALHARGITCVHDYERSAAHARWSRALAQRRRLRVLQHFGEAQLEGLIAAGVESGVGDAWFRLGALKLFADGTLGSRTAAMLTPYEDAPGTGLSMHTADDLAHRVARAIAAGVAVAIHAIGDRAVRDALDAIASAPESQRRALALPPRIEHAQCVAPGDLERFAPLSVVASMQPQHCVSDWEAARRAWGPRAEGSYPWRGFLERGVVLAFGSDAPVEPPDPWLAWHASVTRQRPDGTPEGGFVPAQRLTLDEALTAATRGAARAAGQEGLLGTLRSGAEGDVVLWDRDLHAADPAALLGARPRWTALAGRIVYESSPDSSHPLAADSHRSAP